VRDGFFPSRGNFSTQLPTQEKFKNLIYIYRIFAPFRANGQKRMFGALSKYTQKECLTGAA
jgi:hypothetical protein